MLAQLIDLLRHEGKLVLVAVLRNPELANDVLPEPDQEPGVGIVFPKEGLPAGLDHRAQLFGKDGERFYMVQDHAAKDKVHLVQAAKIEGAGQNAANIRQAAPVSLFVEVVDGLLGDVDVDDIGAELGEVEAGGTGSAAKL